MKFVFTLLRLYQRSGLQKLARLLMPAKLRDMDAMLPAIPAKFFQPAANILPAIGPRRASVAMLNGCVMPLLFGDVNEATVRVLRRNGCEVVFPEQADLLRRLEHPQRRNALRRKQMARRNIDAFLEAGVDAIVVNAAGCGAAMKEYGYLVARRSRPTPRKPSASPPWSKTPANFSPGSG